MIVFFSSVLIVVNIKKDLCFSRWRTLAPSFERYLKFEIEKFRRSVAYPFPDAEGSCLKYFLAPFPRSCNKSQLILQNKTTKKKHRGASVTWPQQVSESIGCLEISSSTLSAMFRHHEKCKYFSTYSGDDVVNFFLLTAR